VLLAVRTFVDPGGADDVAEVRRLQHAITIEQAGAGTF
jgi:hypothetical protein